MPDLEGVGAVCRADEHGAAGSGAPQHTFGSTTTSNMTTTMTTTNTISSAPVTDDAVTTRDAALTSAWIAATTVAVVATITTMGIRNSLKELGYGG